MAQIFVPASVQRALRRGPPTQRAATHVSHTPPIQPMPSRVAVPDLCVCLDDPTSAACDATGHVSVVTDDDDDDDNAAAAVAADDTRECVLNDSSSQANSVSAHGTAADYDTSYSSRPRSADTSLLLRVKEQTECEGDSSICHTMHTSMSRTDDAVCDAAECEVRDDVCVQAAAVSSPLTAASPTVPSFKHSFTTAEEPTLTSKTATGHDRCVNVQENRIGDSLASACARAECKDEYGELSVSVHESALGALARRFARCAEHSATALGYDAASRSRLMKLTEDWGAARWCGRMQTGQDDGRL